jgi:hypothetical protein
VLATSGLEGQDLRMVDLGGTGALDSSLRDGNPVDRRSSTIQRSGVPPSAPRTLPKHGLRGLGKLLIPLGVLLFIVLVAVIATQREVTTSDSTAGLGTYFDDDFIVSRDGDFGRDNLEVQDHPRFGRILRVRYPKGSASHSMSTDGDAPVGGAQLYLKPRYGVPAERMHLRYYVRFPAGFDFVKGGKLPGLYGGTITGGRRSPDGTNGFSTRYMWRRGGVGEVYAYLATSDEQGTSLGRGAWSFKPGDWHLIEQEVVLNDPDKRDGSVRVWVDEREVLMQSNLQFRTVDTLKIEGVFFSTFFGGSDSSWASPKDVHVDFAAFQVDSGYVGPISER